MNVEKRSLRGSLWHQWDLHVHTPASIVHNYPGDPEAAWASYIDDLEALPASFKVLGINDYLFLDGYRRISAERARGRLSNIALILPVIELRLNVFGGSDTRLSRVNWHVIFSDELDPDVIQNQFISALTRQFTLLPERNSLAIRRNWRGVVSREALVALGRDIIAAAPTNQRANYSSPAIEGFNNLTVELSAVRRALDSTFLGGRYITAVGKTEWANVKWADGSIADKRDIINSATCVFTAAESPAAYERGRQSLIAANVNSKLLDCSDAHALSTSPNKDRVGNCWSWIKADLTFGGLLQALAEFQDRVFVGGEPDQIRRVREQPSKYIDRVQIHRVGGSSLAEQWFHGADLPLNSGLIVIIGNKGSGKSALAEIIALVAGTGQAEYMSFLNPSRFRDTRRNLADHFVVTARRADGGKALSRRLSEDPEPYEENRVRHLPQRYLETLCNEMPRGEKTEFDSILERIIFSHLPVESRLGAANLQDLTELIGRANRTEIEARRKDLAKLNEQIWAFEIDMRDETKARILERYRAKRREWRDLGTHPVTAVPEPSDTDPSRLRVRERIRQLTRAKDHLHLLKNESEQQLSGVRKRAADLRAARARLLELEKEFQEAVEGLAALLASVGIEEQAATLRIDHDILDSAAGRLASEEAALTPLLDPAVGRSIPAALVDLDDQLAQLRQQLTAPQEAYELYLKQEDDRMRRRRAILGSSEDADSLLGLRAERARLGQVPGKHKEALHTRNELLIEIHGLHRREAAQHSELYKPLQAFMAKQGVSEDYTLGISSTLVEEGLSLHLLDDMVNRQVSGSFSGVVEGERELDRLLSAADFDDGESVLNVVTKIEERLHADYRTPRHSKTKIEQQMKGNHKPVDLYDYLYGLSYLSPRYGLTFGDKPIYQLSPGEKGTLLLIFFLLADLDTVPLIVDQPEDNLDNQTVYRALVGAFRAAKMHRQVIVVTHNPNVAVVCDADQVVVANMEKGATNRISYVAGAIENPAVLRRIIDILEGTQPAFENRSVKYLIHRFGVLDPPLGADAS